MTQYITEIKKALRDQCGLTPTGGTDKEPLYDAATCPDGIYPMKIDGQLDLVIVRNGCFDCCNLIGTPEGRKAFLEKQSRQNDQADRSER